MSLARSVTPAAAKSATAFLIVSAFAGVLVALVVALLFTWGR